MANKGLFQSKIQRPPKAEAQREAADALNEAGGLAYRPSARQALAQYAVTGCLNATYYADAATQLDTVLALCAEVGPEFVAKTAIYARRQGFMKDMPALLCAWLAAHGAMVLPQAFGRVIDNGKMLRNFVQMLRSGAVGRKSLGSMPKRLVQEWLHRRSVEQLLADSVGQSPSLADVIKMVHPKPVDQARAALYAYLIGKPCEVGLLPAVVQDYLAFKANPGLEVPNVPFQWLTALDLQPRHWVGIACQAQWQMTRMNLNAFARHGVFQVGGMKQRIAARLRDRDAIRNARAFPYQLLCAYTQAADGVPAEVTEALKDAMEIALANVPRLDGKVYVLPDVSGSMRSPVTGQRQGATTAVRCVDVAALVASAMMARNPATEVLPFDTQVHEARLDWRDGVLHNAETLARFGGGGTACSLPLRVLNARNARGNLVIYVSDNESWADSRHAQWETQTLAEWRRFKSRNPRAKLVCIDIQPYATAQAPERADILNIGGFSDAVFEIIDRFAKDELGADHWVGQIDAIKL